MFYFITGTRESSSVTSNAAVSHNLLPPSHGGFDQAESHTIVLSDSDTQDSTEDYPPSPCDSEVCEHTGEIEMQCEETATLLHSDNEDVMIGTSTATEVSVPDNLNTSNTTDETQDAQHEVESNIGNTSVTMHPAVSSGDFDRVVHLKAERELTDNEKFYLLNHHFVPGVGYQFPSHTFGKQSRRFQKQWLTKYSGLVYSEVADGGYCKYCVLFAQCEASVHAFGALVNRPLTNLKKATNILPDHFSHKGCRSHRIAVEKAKAFCNVMTNQSLSIDQQLSSQRAQVIANNRAKLRSIAATIIFCGKQAISLRGHRDDWSDLLECDDESRKQGGNFHALLQFRIAAGDEVLKEHLKTAQQNAIYTSKTIQNEIIVICGDLLRNKILKEVREAQFFSVIADEATDVANDEQLSISVRYVNDTGPQERFLGFHEC